MNYRSPNQGTIIRGLIVQERAGLLNIREVSLEGGNKNIDFTIPANFRKPEKFNVQLLAK